MRRARLLLGLLALAAPAHAGEGGKKDAPPVTPIVGPPTPFSDMMLEVQRLQERMAKGDKAAYGAQRDRMRAIGAAIAAAPAKAFKIKTERDAVVVYLLSGGQPSNIAKIVERGDFPAPERDLLRGAAGYTGGREADAEKLLGYDPGAESLRLGSQLAYAQSVLMTSKDPRKALELLDLARLIAPGTLIEEAALRREIMLVGDLRDAERVAFLARQYVERFGGSLYAGDFVHTLASTAIRFDLCATPADLAKFAALLALTPPQEGRAFLLAVARASVLRGRFEVAAQAAEAARKTAASGSSDEARAAVYDLLARFPGMNDEAWKPALAAIDTAKLNAADRALLAAASYAQARLYDAPPPENYEETWRETAVAAARSPNLPQDADPAAVTIRRAAATLGAVEALAGAPSP